MGYGQPAGIDAPSPLFRMERKWFQGTSIVNFGAYLMAIVGFAFFIPMFILYEVPRVITYVGLALFSIVMLLFIRFLLGIRAAVFELHSDRARLYHGPRLHREVLFGPDVGAGIVKVGYWDDLTPGPGLKRLNVDPSLHDYGAYGPLFGYVFRSANGTIMVSRNKGWSLRDIQAMWSPFMAAVTEHRMQMAPSLDSYLQWRRHMQTAGPGQGPPPERLFAFTGEGPF